MSWLVRDEDARVGGDRRQRGAAAVEDDEIRSEGRRKLGAVANVVGEWRARKPPTGAATANGRHPRERCRLEMILDAA